MFNFLIKNNITRLQKKYEKLQKEAYDLLKVNQSESNKKQEEANEIMKQIAKSKYNDGL